MAPKRKKSKRDKSSTSAPAAAAAVTSSSNNSNDVPLQKVTIKVQKPDPKEDPILVSFPSGVPENPKKTKFIWRQWNPTAIMSRVVEGKDDNGTCVYRAASQGMGYDDRRTKVCVGVFDKKEGTLTLHQAASKGTVFALQQHLPSYKETIEDTMMNRSLFEDFGSAKKRKVLKSQQANRVNVETVIGAGSAMVDSMLNTKNGQTTMSESNRKAVEHSRNNTNSSDGKNYDPSVDAVMMAQEEARKQTLPPYNQDAEEPCDVYDAEQMAGEEGWGRICRVVDACVRKDDFFHAMTRGKPDSETGKVQSPEERGWAPVVLDSLRKLSGRAKEAAEELWSETENPRTTIKYRMRCALLLHHLIRFYRRFHAKGGRGPGRTVPGLEEGQNVWFGIPKELAEHLLNTLATQKMMDESVREGKIVEEYVQEVEGKKPKYKIPDHVPRFMMTPANMDKLSIEIMLVYIMAQRGSRMMVGDITPIAEELDMDVKKAATALRFAGLTVNIAASAKRVTAELKVPLTFQQPKRPGGRGKR